MARAIDACKHTTRTNVSAKRKNQFFFITFVFHLNRMHTINSSSGGGPTRWCWNVRYIPKIRALFLYVCSNVSVVVSSLRQLNRYAIGWALALCGGARHASRLENSIPFRCNNFDDLWPIKTERVVCWGLNRFTDAVFFMIIMIVGGVMVIDNWWRKQETNWIRRKWGKKTPKVLLFGAHGNNCFDFWFYSRAHSSGAFVVHCTNETPNKNWWRCEAAKQTK